MASEGTRDAGSAVPSGPDGIHYQNDAEFAGDNRRRAVNRAALRVPLPQGSLEENDIKWCRRLDLRSFVEQAGSVASNAIASNAIKRWSQFLAIDPFVIDPFGSPPMIGTNQTNACAIDVKARTHCLIDHFQANGDFIAAKQVRVKPRDETDIIGHLIATRKPGQEFRWQPFIRMDDGSKTVPEKVARQPSPDVPVDHAVDTPLPYGDLDEWV